jgi:hypothetical protein
LPAWGRGPILRTRRDVAFCATAFPETSARNLR